MGFRGWGDKFHLKMKDYSELFNITIDLLNLEFAIPRQSLLIDVRSGQCLQ
jgi:hypothetical protein